MPTVDWCSSLFTKDLDLRATKSRARMRLTLGMRNKIAEGKKERFHMCRCKVSTPQKALCQAMLVQSNTLITAESRCLCLPQPPMTLNQKKTRRHALGGCQDLNPGLCTLATCLFHNPRDVYEHMPIQRCSWVYTETEQCSLPSAN